ncbi:acyl carrier protein [Paenibacillus apiarius]|uniref:Phosphopantetheine-binding protein n=1 Tax=Paenibacillus apiarius TaxID=46240 RepID=A0ABT4DLQ3_9BACL|nr:phosphopantetheine-binding protein [Paenibacillus apiarius]MBN3526111.1 acyl carrier protein [Paenibacillus apiarius]MCY9513736.1 phosphopantetheine-binding protein [Paenibacillus apiarius]MCY9518287.1 phosphopantetheine-binding protein [Paenibacillus apiarius]MCY9551312.1 phosphopantetheine-binding protein [Paenibacillus apiarius]MCY9558466.1 phosphopantetheine-binding protein [Paenibacillus apiarius]
MNRDAIEQEIADLIKGMLNLPFVDGDTVLVGHTGVLDSMTVVRLLAEIEKRFDFTLDEDDLTLDSISSVKRLTEWVIQSKQANH